MKFNTVQEVTSWENFIFNGEIYDLSHLNARWVEYLDKRDEKNISTYKFIVTYGLHCFTKDSDDISSKESQVLIYNGPRESRTFNFERYQLSTQLPSIVESLGENETLVCHAGYGKLGASQFCKKHFFYCSASVPARVLYNTRAGTL
ncbi:hypothetical protein, partial [Microcoleus sp. N9_A4]|uniref:hypothetical protein n=1 Tax=Microcoleus sp. N9_A4 TaxID=3055383 RepID=UPI002FD3F087